MGNGCDLVKYLLAEEHQNVKKFIDIEHKLLQIFEEAQSKGIIIGNCDLEDFFLADNDPIVLTL